VNQTQLMAAGLPGKAKLARLDEARAAAEQVREVAQALGATAQGQTAAQLSRPSSPEVSRWLEAQRGAPTPAVIDPEREARQAQTRQAVRAAEARPQQPTLDLLRSGVTVSTGRAAAQPPTKQAPVRRRAPHPARPVPRPAGAPPPTAAQVAARRAHAARTRAFAFLRHAGLIEEAEHLLAIEERVHAGGRPARYHAALSTRLLLEGVADRCFPARAGSWTNRSGETFAVGRANVGNRLIAFVEDALGPGLWNADKEHLLFIARVDTVVRFGGRGPHRIRTADEGERHLLSLLEVLDLLARAYVVTLSASATA
jgi:hypothetical protein